MMVNSPKNGLPDDSMIRAIRPTTGRWSNVMRRGVVVAAWVALAITAGWGAAKTAVSGPRTISAADRAFWSFQPVKKPAEPDVQQPEWCRNTVDKFILAKLEAEGIAPAPEADRLTLIRRATFDVTGLPPTEAEVNAFLNDQSPDAYEKLVDRLLASPAYGQYWGRHWLDLARYAESDGFKQDAYRSTAWRYRDYVIRSFNSDKPYDRFVCEQLAGDEMWPDDPDAWIATGFLRNGQYEYNNRDVVRQWTQMLTDVTDVTGDAFLGLSIGCAHCHDHKFDPILQSDYYRFQAFFAPMLPRSNLPIGSVQEKANYNKALAAWENKTASIRAQIEPIEKASLAAQSKSAIGKFPDEMQAILLKDAKDRTPLEEQLAQLAGRQIYDPSENQKPKILSKEKAKYAELEEKLKASEKLKPAPLPTGLFMTDVGPVAPPTFSPRKPDVVLEPGAPVVLEDLPGGKVVVTPTKTTTGRRTALARWIASKDNPLTARVMVNRIWQFHFGRGLVATSSDFGHLGTPPSHPQLLDFLASQFVEGGWHMKPIHRLILTSATYRQAALRPTPAVAKLKDPEDRWLWRMTTRRLDAEQIRDAMLATSGELQPMAGGASAEITAPVRSIFTKLVRNTHDPILEAFDVADSFSSVCQRNVTTTPTQSLLMINGDFPLRRATALAARVRQQAASADMGSLVDEAYRLTYLRLPTARERKAALGFMSSSTTPAAVDPTASASQAGGSAFELPVTQPMPQRQGQAILVRSAKPGDMLCLSKDAALPDSDFTVEAYVQLESYYPDSKVRVVASRWDGNHAHPGWTLGVTGDKSKFQPHHLILQLIGSKGYEVVASGFAIDLHKAYYLSASVGLVAEGGAPSVTFHLKDLTDMDAPIKSAAVSCKTNSAMASTAELIIGGRAESANHSTMGWDGLIDEVRLCRSALKPEQLLYNGTLDAKPLVAGYWQFEENPGLLRDSSGSQKDLRPLVAQPASSSTSSGSTTDRALIDFCHVLLNSNEFLYVD
jgi:hypothetical protein